MSFHISFDKNESFIIGFSKQNGNQDFNIDFSGNTIEIPVGDYYTGPYSVIPLVGEDQILETKNHAMYENVVVSEIPYAEVSNTAGGKTATIGGI